METLLISLLKALWFLLPAGIANLAAALSGKIFPKLDFPLDFGKTYKNKRIFGDHKTIRGLVFGTAVGTSIYFIQVHLSLISPSLQTIELNNFSTNTMLAILLPLGGLLGDAIKSFFKRQLSMKPGKSWFPFDQVDWIVGTLLFSYAFVKPSFYFAILAIMLGIILHLLTKWIGYILGLQEEKF